METVKRIIAMHRLRDVADISTLRIADVLAVPGVGVSGLARVRYVLADIGLSLQGDRLPSHWLRRREIISSCPPRFTVVIDTREQNPWHFSESVRAFLPSGDYSLLGFEGQIAIERKSHDDLYATLSAGRDRFEKEINRLASYDYAAVVVEAGWNRVMQKPDRSNLDPASVFGSIVAISQRWPRVQWWLLPDRAKAESFALRAFERFFKDQVLIASLFAEEKRDELAGSREGDSR